MTGKIGAAVGEVSLISIASVAVGYVAGSGGGGKVCKKI